MEGTFCILLLISFSWNSVSSLFKVGIISRGISQNHSSSDISNSRIGN